jgi:hypothetical protein
MFPAPLLFASLIIAAPAFLFIDGPIAYGFVASATALSLLIIGLRIRPGEASFLSAIILPIAVVAIVPALWMLLQILPMKFFGLANPIWQSAATALGRPLIERISIDPGATLICLFRYLSTLAIVFIAAVMAVDRHRSEWILFTLVAAATLVAAIAIANGHSNFTLVPAGSEMGSAYEAAIDCAALGVQLAVAATLHTIERQNMQGARRAAFWFGLAITIYLLALATCALAVVLASDNNAYFAASCGVATLVAVLIIRRFTLGPWGYSAILSIALIVAVAAVTVQPMSGTLGIALAYATSAPGPMIALTQRMMTEASWIGTGAGTFAAALPIYRDVDELATGSIAPTAIAAIAVEMGRPFLWGGMLAIITLIITLVRRAARRGRDSLYSTAGASCAVTLTLLSFGNSALFATPVVIITASAIGIAIAQSKSRLV